MNIIVFTIHLIYSEGINLEDREHATRMEEGMSIF